MQAKKITPNVITYSTAISAVAKAGQVCGTLHCSVLQRVAACCSVLQCVTACCSVLQRVAACCSVFAYSTAIFAITNALQVSDFFWVRM